MKKTKIAAYTGSIVMASAFAVAGFASASVRAEDADTKTPQDVVKIDEKNFPDPEFRKYVSDNYDGDMNGVLDETEISNVESIYVEETFIESFKGIEHFPNLLTFHYDANYGILVELDLSKNTKLQYFSCSGGKLSSLDLSHNRDLSFVYCPGNVLERLILG